MKTLDEILLFLLKNPGGEFSINGLARLIGRKPSGVFRQLKKLENKSVVFGRKVGNATAFDLNLENPEARKMCELALMSEKTEMLSRNPLASVLAKDMVKLEKYADILVLFGSVLEKKEPRDIDVLVISKPGFAVDIEKTCNELSTMHGKPVMPLILSYADFVGNLRKRDEVIAGVVGKGIILKGYEKFVEGLKNAKIRVVS